MNRVNNCRMVGITSVWKWAQLKTLTAQRSLGSCRLSRIRAYGKLDVVAICGDFVWYMRLCGSIVPATGWYPPCRTFYSRYGLKSSHTILCAGLVCNASAMTKPSCTGLWLIGGGSLPWYIRSLLLLVLLFLAFCAAARTTLRSCYLTGHLTLHLSHHIL